MNDIDQRILAALSSEDRELLEQYQEKSFTTQVIQSFQGKLGPIIVVTWLLAIPVTLLMVVSGYYFFTANEEQTIRLAMVGFICSVLASGFVKTFYYNHLGLLNLMREIKRLELQVSLLAEKILK